ncbi:MAG TPA: hypothetical protein VFM88_18780 [Vicinamibacteria bacterium]|nr:hypothetical protein [Vicinamibacteria bacterium]
MRAATALLLLWAVAPALAADDPYKVKLLLGGGYEVGTQSFSQTVSLEQFAETATIATAYEAEAAPGIDVGVQFNAFKHVGVAVAGTLYDRDLGGRFEASFPHPFFFDRNREATDSVSGKMKETAVHASVVAFGHSGSLDFSGWAGVSFFKVEADLLTNVNYSHEYPYDSVTVTSKPVTTASDRPIGFNVGASLDWRFSKSVGFGVQGRFSQAQAKLSAPNAADTEVDAGGFQVGGGLRIYF